MLVLGATGAIGHFLLPLLAGRGLQLRAASRQPPEDPEFAGARWQRLDLAVAGEAGFAVDAVLSAGPLDLAAQWLPRSGLAPHRIVAFSSTSAAAKQASPDPAERALAARLQDAERGLSRWCAQRGSALTLLRPTLVYGAGLDRNLSRIAALARRLGWVAIPLHATGLRQPVHAQDLAAAAAKVLALPHTPQACYDLPGGETLSYRAMVARVLDALAPRPRLLELPMPLLRAALSAAHAGGRLRDVTPATLQRTREDLAFDAAPAQRDLGWQPRMFTVTPDMLSP